MGCSRASGDMKNYSRPRKLHVLGLPEARSGGVFGDCKQWGTTPMPRTSVSLSTVPLLPAQDKESIQRVLQAVDKANGYCFGVQEQRSLEAMMSAAVGADFHFSSYPCSPAFATGGGMGLENHYSCP